MSAVLFLGLLVTDALMLPDQSWRRSTVGNAVQSMVRLQPIACSTRPFAAIHRSDDDGRLFLAWSVEHPDSAGHIGYSTLVYSPAERGFWGITRITVTREIVHGWSSDLEQPDPAVLDSLLVRFLGDENHRYAQQAQLAAEGSHSEHRVLWLGYIHNLTSLLLLAGFLYAAPSFAQLARAARRRSRIAAGLCPICRYDLTGLPGPVCPECGQVWDDGSGVARA